jgi:glycosyltransferase involved in cell wall biosynthesis
MVAPVNILLDGGFYNGHGMSEGNRILLRILDGAGYRVRIVPRDIKDKYLVLPQKEIDYISSFENTKLSSNDVYLYNSAGWSAQIRPEFRINIARTTFETDRLPERWVKKLNEFEEVWVQCTFNIKTFVSAGVKVPLRYAPNFFDMSRYVPKGKKLPLPVSQSFKFLSVFDIHDQRKGYDLLLLAFLNEFSSEDDVALIIKNRNDHATSMLSHLIESHPKEAKRKPAIHIINKMLPDEDILCLYRSCNAFVLPSRGEGWGRPYFEAMLMEMPVIGTNWSGQTDFMNENNSFLIDVERLSVIENNKKFPFYNGHRWAEPSVIDLQRKMRIVFEHEKEAKRKGIQARKDLIGRYSMKETSKIIIGELEKFNTRLRK